METRKQWEDALQDSFDDMTEEEMKSVQEMLERIVEKGGKK